MESALILLTAFFIGSIPTAVLVSRLLTGVDIRQLGDGNMGARNTTAQIGWKGGLIVAAGDFAKGAGAVVLARSLDQGASMQLLSGLAAVAGHDFPVLAGFRGGQGMAASLGVLFVLMPEETLLGLAVFGLAYLILRAFDPSAAVGLGLIVLLAWASGLAFWWIAYAAALFCSIALKKWLDTPWRERVRRSQGAPLGHDANGVVQPKDSER